MKRLAVALFALALLAAPLAVEGQQPTRLVQIGVLSNGFPSSSPQYLRPRFDAFLEGLRALGYVDGQNIVIHWRFTSGRDDQLAGVADELVRLKVDAIVTTGTPPTLAAKRATRTIPIIMAASGDPVGSGLVDSLAHPGGNITGQTLLTAEVYPKRLELLKEAIPEITRVAVLHNPTNPVSLEDATSTQAGGEVLRVKVLPVEARDASELDRAFSAMQTKRVQALVVASDLKYVGQRGRLVELALRAKLPAMFFTREFVEAGGLMSYGPNYVDLYRRAASYVDKILKGAKPADLPVEQPTKFEFVINLKTAKALGLKIPPSVLARADEVIQ
jgi:putative ABC transport system substrate-binding protein